MNTNNVFKRYELKYFLTTTQYLDLVSIMSSHMQLDSFGRSLINNIYFDTPDYRLIRRSLEKPCYKEKLRVRSYGTTKESSTVFIEMKKKYQGIVYKRRISTTQQEAFQFLTEQVPLADQTQIVKELDYFLRYYENLAPALGLYYEREAFYGLENHDFRMTFDHNIHISTTDVSLLNKGHCTYILPKDIVLLEVKTGEGLPSWLLAFFRENKIYKTSFSKYGTAYQKYLLPTLLGGDTYVA